MDYGHTGKTGSTGTQDFFTAGAGTDSVNTNNFEAENNLDLTNQSTSWNNASTDRDHRSIGSRAANSIETDHDREEVTSPELGRIVNLEMPPNSSEAKNKSHSEMAEASLNSDILLNLETFREENDRISSKTLENTERAVSEFEKGKISPADLDDARWEATKAYLKNSFGRDISA